MSDVKTIKINCFLNSSSNHTIDDTHYPCSVLHCFERGKHNKLYVVGIEHVDGDVYRLVTRYGSRNHPHSLVRSEKIVHTFQWCYEEYQKLVLQKLNKGYEYVNTYDYHRKVPLEYHLGDALIMELLSGSRNKWIVDRFVTIIPTKLLIVQDEFEAEVARQILG